MDRIKNRREYIDKWRFMLMLLGGISYMGFPSKYSLLIKIFLSFAAPAFFVLSGYLVMRESESRSERILRAIKKTAIVFGVLSVCYFLLNLAIDFKGTIYTVTTLRFWFDFIVLNIYSLPIGGHLWYVQALLYAYIILYFVEKLKLLKYDWLIIFLCFVAALLTGELSGVIGFHFAGYEYLMGNFITRAVPYILLGRIIHTAKYEQSEESYKKKSIFFIIAGICLLFAEIELLALSGYLIYYGHFMGHIFMAAGVSMLAVYNEDMEFCFEKFEKFSVYGTNWIYYLAQPLFVILNKTFFFTDMEQIFAFGLSAVVSIVLSVGIVMLTHRVVKLR